MERLVGSTVGYGRHSTRVVVGLIAAGLSLINVHAAMVRLDVMSLKGISSSDGKHIALVEAPPSSARESTKFLILEPGKSQDGIEFVGFDADTRTARFRDAQKERTIQFAGGKATLHLKDAEIRQVVALYARWTSRIQVVGSPVGGVRITFTSEQNEPVESVLQKLKNISRDKGFILQEVTDRFLLVDRLENVKALASAAEAIGTKSRHNARAKALLAENPIQVNFNQAHMGKVLELYSELTCRTLLHSSRLPLTLFITLKSEFPVSRADAIKGIEAVLALNNVQTRAVGDAFILVTMPAQAEVAKKIGDELESRLAEERAGDAKAQPFSGPHSFINMPLVQFCSIYARAMECTLLDEGAIPRHFVNLESSTGWTKAETLGAYDALLALEGFKMVREGEKGLKLVPR